jgi:hypothetical protein
LGLAIFARASTFGIGMSSFTTGFIPLAGRATAGTAHHRFKPIEPFRPSSKDARFRIKEIILDF